MQRQEDRRRRQGRDYQREQQYALGIGDHLFAHRPFVHRDLDPRARLAGRGAADLQHPVPRLGERGRGVPYRRGRHGLVEVEDSIYFGRHAAAEHVGRMVAHPELDAVGRHLAQQALFQRLIDRPGRRRLERERGDMGVRQPVRQIHHAEARDGRRIDQQFRQHDEKHGEHEQARRKRTKGARQPHPPPLKRYPTGMKRAAALRYAPAGAGTTQGEGRGQSSGTSLIPSSGAAAYRGTIGLPFHPDGFRTRRWECGRRRGMAGAGRRCIIPAAGRAGSACRSPGPAPARTAPGSAAGFPARG